MKYNESITWMCSRFILMYLQHTVKYKRCNYQKSIEVWHKGQLYGMDLDEILDG